MSGYKNSDEHVAGNTEDPQISRSAGSARNAHDRLNQRRWRRGLRSYLALLGCVLVAFTAVMLMVPAISMTRGDLICGYEEHAHTKACYEQVLVCGMEEGEGAKPASEDEPAVEGHKHTKDCYERQLVCEVPEHRHSDACYAPEVVEEPSAVEDAQLKPADEFAQDAALQDSQANQPDASVDDGLDGESGVDSDMEIAAADAQDSEVDSALAADDPNVSDESAIPGSASPDNPGAQQFHGELKDVTGKVTLAVDAEAPNGALPQGAVMKLKSVKRAKVERAIDDAIATAAARVADGSPARDAEMLAAERANSKVESIQAVDITFIDAEGNEVEPTSPVTVKLASSQIKEHVEGTADSAIREVADTGVDADIAARPLIVHVANDGKADVVDVLAKKQLKQRDLPAAAANELVFDAGEFSVYAIVYTVDFHWEVDGQSYEFSIKGGSAIALSELLGALGVAAADDMPDFMANINSVEFSDPALASVTLAEIDTTVGAIKQNLGLACEYSTDLTADQIAAIDAIPIVAGDWAFISLRPFTSDEALVVTMRDGAQFTVRVTDAHEMVLSDSSNFDISKTYLISYNDAGGYHVLKTDGSVETFANTDNFDKLGNDYQWAFYYVFTEKDRETSLDYTYYFIRPVAQKTHTIALNEVGEDLIQYGTNNVAVIPQNSGYVLLGYNHTVDKHIELGFESGEFVSYDDRTHNPKIMQIYEQDPLPRYSFTVVTADADRGVVSGRDETGVVQNNASQFVAQTNDSKKNNSRISAVPNAHGDGRGHNKWEFDYWDLDGVKLEGVGATIAAGSIDIPKYGSVLTAHFKQNSAYIVPDSEKQGTSFEDMTAWLNEMLGKDLPLDKAGCKKTAEVYDYENRIYRVDLTSKSDLTTFDGMIDLGFILDVSNSMKFPSSLEPITGLTNIDVRALNGGFWDSGDNSWHNQIYSLTQGQTYYIISDPHNTSTVYRIEHRDGTWKFKDASSADSAYAAIGSGSLFKGPQDSTDDNHYHYQMYRDADPGHNRFYYLNDSMAQTTDALAKILDTLTIASANNPSVRVAYNTFNRYLNYTSGATSDANTPAGQSQDFASVSKITADFSYAAGGGTRPDRGLIDALNNWNWQAGTGNRYAILITDGAPQGARTDLGEASNIGTSDIIPKVKTAATNLKNSGVKLITIGLSIDNVDGGRILLYDLADSVNGEKMFFSAQTGSDLESILLQIVRTIMKDATVVGKVTDAVGDAFYPVDKRTGAALVAGNKIDLQGNKLDDAYSGPDAYGVIQSDGHTIVWENQLFTHDGWHGTVYVKAKEDLLGGNAVQTNSGNAAIEAQKYKTSDNGPEVSFNTTLIDKLKTLKIDDLESPRVNVNELGFGGTDTEWTVYLGTEVNPKEQLKELWKSILVEEVVTAADDINGDGLPDTVVGASHFYPLVESIADDRESAGNGSKKTFAMNALIKTLAEEPGKSYTWWDYAKHEPNWDTFLAQALTENGLLIGYDAYSLNGSDGSTIKINLSKEILTGEEADVVGESPHPTTVVNGIAEGEGATIVDVPIEKYTLTVLYSPDYSVVPVGQGGSGTLDFHTGTFGTIYQGHAAGTETSRNTHEINAFAKKVQLLKADQEQAAITGNQATFGLYRKASDEELVEESIQKSTLSGLDGYYVLVWSLETDSNGVVTTNPLPLLANGEPYYLIESSAPAGFDIMADVLKVAIDMTDHNTWTVLFNGTASQTKPDPYVLSDWLQEATIKVTALDGTTSGYAVLDADHFTYDHINDAADAPASVMYKIINNAGVELPVTGGPGTAPLYALGGLAVVMAAFVALRRRHA